MSLRIATAVAAVSAARGAVPVEHPVLRFTRGSSGFPSFAAEIERATDKKLRQMYLDEMVTREAVVPRLHYRRVYAAVGLWQATGEQRYRDQAKRACLAVLADLVDADDERLRVSMDPDRGFTPRSRMARDAAYHFALLYHLAGDRAYANRAAVLLTRFAEVMPDWPIQNPHYGPMEQRKLLPRTWPDYHTTDRVNGVWGGWIYGAIGNGAPLAYAYDLIYNSGELQRLGTLDTVERELNWAVDFQLGYGREMGNMDKTTMQGLIDVARVLGRPEVVHHCIQWVRDMYQTMFFADGWWHEGAPSYHQQIHLGMQTVIRDYLRGYTDPPGFRGKNGVRYDNLDLFSELKRPIQRATDVLNTVHQPNGDFQCIHDTGYPQVNWEKVYVKEGQSQLWGCMGHVILGTGREEDTVQASLHFSGTHGHAHCDTLNLVLFAKGRELISETRYRPIAGSKSTREWHTMTAGHVTVVVDEKNQACTTVRQRQPSDAIPGIPDGKYRWAGHGNRMVEGKLRIHNTDFDMVQVVEADGSRAYHETNRSGVYRRTIALVKISDVDTYVVDIFRVQGGKTHDYMLHGCLAAPHAADVSVALEQSMPGTLHKYIGGLTAAATDAAWSLTFRLNGSDAALKTFFLPQPGTQIVRGEAPAMRRVGPAPFFCVRRTDGESVYAAVHHPFVGESAVRGVELVEATMDRVAFRVALPDRTDTIESTGEGFTHTAEGQWAYEIGGEHTHTGTLSRTRRVEAGDDVDAFVTTTPLPTDGSLDGFTLMVDLGGLLVQSFTIERVERQGEETLIRSRHEPGMTISPDVVRLNYFPCWGIRARAAFRINGVSLRR